jgi:RNA-directed DNA polymerase
MKLLRQRVDDTRFLNLIWKFLRAGVLEHQLFQDTRLGTPQGGIITPKTILQKSRSCSI